MKRNSGFILAAITALLLYGCFGNGGSSAPAPNNVVVTAKDSRVIVTWDMTPGVDYWLWRAIGTGVTTQNCMSMPSCTTTLGVSSPLTVSGLANGTTYSFTINGRINGGPGGDGSPAVSATPRLAGATWSTGTPLVGNLRGVAYGAMYVAVGDGGAAYSSADGKNWTTLTTNLPSTTTLYAVSYDAAHGKYLSVGSDGTGGTVAAFTPATSTWAQTSGASTTLYGIANNGAGLIVATGASGTIVTSSDGLTWTPATSVPAPTNTLYGVTYGYDKTNSRYVFVAVGAAGTVLYSTDGANWTATTSGTSYDLKSVIYGAAAGVFVAVGTSGTVLTSPDGITWTAQPSIPTATLNAVTFSSGRRFVAVADDGNIFYSEYSSAGATWTQVTPPVTTTNALYAITTGGLYDYSAVGSNGSNFYSD